ncbi:MAG TPA: nucleotidyltransferase family protein [Chitinophagaceae bacterium]|nr:nucleotidyltransferase family protein [Chitinophagaceae bacterium]
MLLAAGASRRLGRPKQLLPFQGRPLLLHTLQAALDSGARPVVLVLGAGAGKIGEEVKDPGVQVVVNTGWTEGMAASIRCGVGALMEAAPEAEGLILMVCDQPFVTGELLSGLIAAYRDTGKPLVTCGYGGTFGPPSFFHRRFFGELLELTGDTGARGIIRRKEPETVVIPFPAGATDVDTEGDYEQLKRSSAP